MCQGGYCYLYLQILSFIYRYRSYKCLFMLAMLCGTIKQSFDCSVKNPNSSVFCFVLRANQPTWHGYWTTPEGQTFTPKSQSTMPQRPFIRKIWLLGIKFIKIKCNYLSIISKSYLMHFLPRGLITEVALFLPGLQGWIMDPIGWSNDPVKVVWWPFHIKTSTVLFFNWAFCFTNKTQRQSHLNFGYDGEISCCTTSFL